MERLAVTDALTRLYNRHYFNRAIEQEIKRAERYRRPLSVLMMDVDNFKAYNDRHGHLEGDKLLRSIAELLHSRMRITDLLARFGGDEFVAILPETDFEQAQAVARKIEQAMSSRFEQEGLGMSIGIAISRAGISATSLLAEADKKLYQVKPLRGRSNGA
jgi:diguanylate cyclase (GGDEF)-like protein